MEALVLQLTQQQALDAQRTKATRQRGSADALDRALSMPHIDDAMFVVEQSWRARAVSSACHARTMAIVAESLVET